MIRIHDQSVDHFTKTIFRATRGSLLLDFELPEQLEVNEEEKEDFHGKLNMQMAKYSSKCVLVMGDFNAKLVNQRESKGRGRGGSWKIPVPNDA